MRRRAACMDEMRACSDGSRTSCPHAIAGTPVDWHESCPGYPPGSPAALGTRGGAALLRAAEENGESENTAPEHRRSRARRPRGVPSPAGTPPRSGSLPDSRQSPPAGTHSSPPMTPTPSTLAWKLRAKSGPTIPRDFHEDSRSREVATAAAPLRTLGHSQGLAAHSRCGWSERAGGLPVSVCMSKSRWLRLGAVLMGLVGGTGAGYYTAQPAKCVFCPTYPCFGNCGNQCVCMRNGPQPGTCVTFDRVQQYREQGYSEVVMSSEASP